MRTEAGSALGDAFARGRTETRALVMPFLVCAYPTESEFVELARACADGGADVLEVGIPFSDPIMDGPVIQAASGSVLARGLRTERALDLIGEASRAASIPIVAMTYYNVIFRYGLDRFAADAVARGVAGVIVPDLSVEDSDAWCAAAASAGLATVFMASQTSTPERLARIGAAARGFVYAASLLGVTGVRETLNHQTRALVERVRTATDVPIAVGIGVSTPAHAREVAAFADGVIVGSAVVKLIGEAEDPTSAVRAFVADLRAAVQR